MQKLVPAVLPMDGFAEHDRQIGQTGVTVRPGYILPGGISGQIQHIAGMQESSMIISINNDEDAPINTIADYVINGTVEEVIPKMIKFTNKIPWQSWLIFISIHRNSSTTGIILLMKRIVDLERKKPRRQRPNCRYAPVDFEDGNGHYDKVLEIVGEICGIPIAPNAEGVDHEGPPLPTVGLRMQTNF